MKEKGNWVTKEKREIPHNLYRITQQVLKLGF